MKKRTPEITADTYDITHDFWFLEPIDVGNNGKAYGSFHSSVFPSAVMVKRTETGLYYLESDWVLPKALNGTFTSITSLKQAACRYLDPAQLPKPKMNLVAGEPETIEPDRTVTYETDGMVVTERYYETGPDYLVISIVSPHFKAPLVAIRKRDNTTFRFYDDGSIPPTLMGSYTSPASVRQAVVNSAFRESLETSTRDSTIYSDQESLLARRPQ